jgi:hypothetical protein
VNKESVDGRRIKDPSSLLGAGTNPGDFAWEFDFTHFPHGATVNDAELTLYLHWPGELRWSPIRLRRGAQGGERVWGWDGNLDRPTLTPSVHHPNVWHGHITGGRLVSCP